MVVCLCASYASHSIVEARDLAPLRTVGDLEVAVGPLYNSRPRPGKKTMHPLTRVFQALRIAVNDELGAVEALLPAALRALKPGGRLLAISFHSLEDRLVKRAMQAAAGRQRRLAVAGCSICPTGQNVEPVPGSRMLLEAQGMQSASQGCVVTRKPIVAGPAEVAANPRARSAKLRCFERVAPRYPLPTKGRDEIL